METSFNFLVSLWRNYNNASSLLTKAIGGTENEVGEFAEILVANYYGGEQLSASNKSADIKTKDGKLIQVKKSRKIEKITTTSLNVIRSWDFDLLVVVLFNKEGNVLKAIEIDSETAKKLSTRNDHQNGNVLTTNNELLNNQKAKDITTQLQNLLDGKESFIPDFIDSKNEDIRNKEQENGPFSGKLFSPPVIEFYPENINTFKRELLRVKQAKRTWFYSNGSKKSETWNASNFTESSDIKANIKTNSTFRKWKELGIVKVKLEIL